MQTEHHPALSHPYSWGEKGREILWQTIFAAQIATGNAAMLQRQKLELTLGEKVSFQYGTRSTFATKTQKTWLEGDGNLAM